MIGTTTTNKKKNNNSNNNDNDNNYNFFYDFPFLPLSLFYLRSTPLPVTVTTRIITFLVGDPYKPSFATVTGRGVDPSFTILRCMGFFVVLRRRENRPPGFPMSNVSAALCCLANEKICAKVSFRWLSNHFKSGLGIRIYIYIDCSRLCLCMLLFQYKHFLSFLSFQSIIRHRCILTFDFSAYIDFKPISVHHLR